jgi:hypothetical protein
MDEAYSYGYNNLRDAATLTPKKEIAPLVIPDDITNLPSLYGFIKFPDGFPAARIKLEWRDYKQVASGFVPRAIIPPKHPDDDSAMAFAKPKARLGGNGTSEDGGHENSDPKPRSDKEIVTEREKAESRPRTIQTAQKNFKWFSDEPTTEAEREHVRIGAADEDENLRRTTDVGRIEQSIDDNGKPNAPISRPGMIARPQTGNIEERQAAMQRELHTHYGDDRSADTDIEMDDD